MTTIVRAHVAHTPRDPFEEGTALDAFADGAVAFASGRVLACGAYRDVRAGHPEAAVLDARSTILRPVEDVLGARVEDVLGALFTLARGELIAEVRVAGRIVWSPAALSGRSG